MEIEELTVKQICNCIAVINKMTEEKLIKFNPNKAYIQFNYDKATRYLEKQNIKQQKQIEAYENMRKEAKNFIQENKNKTMATYGDNYDYEVCLFEEDIKELENILNKVGGNYE